jgi:hypothetical protein
VNDDWAMKAMKVMKADEGYETSIQ